MLQTEWKETDMSAAKFWKTAYDFEKAKREQAEAVLLLEYVGQGSCYRIHDCLGKENYPAHYWCPWCIAASYFKEED